MKLFAIILAIPLLGCAARTSHVIPPGALLIKPECVKPKCSGTYYYDREQNRVICDGKMTAELLCVPAK